MVMLIVTGNAMAYEETPFVTVDTYEDYEVREYQSFIVAEVLVTEDFDKAGNSAFKVLFSYISGNNLPKQDIEMTTPVIQQSVEGDKIAMTTPVIQSPADNQGGEYRFSFVMPSEYTIETLPQPTSELISIREVPAKLAAVRKFSGSWSEGNFLKNETLLIQSLDDNGVETIGEPEYARYNSPFTLWFLRRNEVIVEISR